MAYFIVTISISIYSQLAPKTSTIAMMIHALQKN